MNILNITFDLETCALCSTAAVMSIEAVTRNANAEDNPFTDGFSDDYCFYRHVDLRLSFADGLTGGTCRPSVCKKDNERYKLSTTTWL